MDPRSSRGREVVIDVESGLNAKGEESSRVGINSEKLTYEELNKIWSGYATTAGSIRDGEAMRFSRGIPNSTAVPVSNEELPGDRKIGDRENASLLEKKTGSEKPKKKNCKKPPRPPRPPKAPSLDAVEEKLVREISEHVKSKRERVERMKALKKMKNAKSTSSTSNIWALIITALFCFVIFWQGFSSRSSSNLSFEGSPVSSVGTGGGLISVQLYKNTSGSNSNDSSSASPNIVEPVIWNR